MRLIIKLYAQTNTYRAYFDGTAEFYGEGASKEAAITQLVEKIHAVLKAISIIQQGM